MKKILFIGLGVMGFPMAGHLSKSGFELFVYNRTEAKSNRWLEQYSGQNVKTPDEVIKDMDYVISCVGNDNDLDSLYLSNFKLISKSKPNTVFIDHSTSSANIAQQCYTEAQEYNCHYIDAPVSGGEQGAIDGKLSIMAGGDEAIFKESLPVLEAYSKKAVLIGPSGSGQYCKMVNQICIAGLVQSLSEGIYFAQEVGLDIYKVLEAISKGAAQSWQMDNRAETMAKGEFDFGFAVEWMVKDLNLCKDEVKDRQIKLPVMDQVETFYQTLLTQGHNRWDTSSLIELLKKK